LGSDLLLGHDAALGRLQGQVARGRLSQAYLFAGPEGIGKKRAALEFARALGARAIVVARPPDRHEVQIAQVREVIRELGLTSPLLRVVIFDDAERMSEEAMNACLKTLEEPPRGVLLVLVSSAPERLLGTLRSRCQTIHFHALPDPVVERFAQETLRLGESQSHAVAELAHGSIGAACELAPEIDRVLELLGELQSRVLAGEFNPVVEALGKIRDTEEARALARRELRLLLHALREVLRAKSGARPVLASAAFLERMGRLDEDELVERMETLLEHERMIGLNANVTLAMEDALLRL
jgi:DNA polymerase-3 subunit delta'